MEEKLANFVVDTISMEYIKPSSPTPSHFQTFTLSFSDQVHPSATSYTRMILFYTNPPKKPSLDIIKNFKDSLSKTLKEFYPIAGRCMDESTLSCKDQGIPFIETHVNCSLSDYLASSHKVTYLAKLMPPKPLFSLNSELVPLGFQVNVFACGGVVIGCYKLHKVLDGTSLMTFLNYWSGVASQRCENDLVKPLFEPPITAFPPRSPSELPKSSKIQVPAGAVEPKKSSAVLIPKSFKFTKECVSELRAKATSKLVPNPTRFETLVGFVWQHSFAAACESKNSDNNNNNKTELNIVVNMRPRTTPPLPRESMGNLITCVFAHARKGMELQDFVQEIHSAVSGIKKRVEFYQAGDEKGVEALYEDTQVLFRFQPGVYGVSNWCQLGMNVLDFGFGKPVWTVPTEGIVSPKARNFMYLAKDPNNEGCFEAWVYLEVNEMRILESNPEFLAFASPY